MLASSAINTAQIIINAIPMITKVVLFSTDVVDLKMSMPPTSPTNKTPIPIMLPSIVVPVSIGLTIGAIIPASNVKNTIRYTYFMILVGFREIEVPRVFLFFIS